MVDTVHVMNGDELVAQALPERVHLAAEEARRIPSPGAQRELKAQTGRGFDQLCGPDADGADRIQTLIWLKLRRQFPGLAWDACADVEVQVEEGALDVDPTRLVVSESSPPSADSGG
jgi:hypothetical protein